MASEPSWAERVRGIGMPIAPGHPATLACVISWSYDSFAAATERTSGGISVAVTDAELGGETRSRQHALLFLGAYRRFGLDEAMARANRTWRRMAPPQRHRDGIEQAKAYLAIADLERFLRGGTQSPLF